MTTDISVNLSVSFEQAGKAFACPGERVMFICEVNRSTSVQVAAEPFICRADPVLYFATDPPGSPGRTMPTDVFQANLTDIQREPGTLMAYYKVTLTATLTNEIANTTVECSDQLTSSSSIQRKTLIESRKNKIPFQLRLCCTLNIGQFVDLNLEIAQEHCTILRLRMFNS